jgi:RNA polymerase sigma-70 factor (ECF subfamily)
MKSSSDQELVKLLARGDHRAFETVFDRCRVPVFRFALHMSGSHEIADEVTQETFLFLLRRPELYSSEKGTLVNFLLGLARNLVRRSRRDATDDVSLEDDGVESELVENEGHEGPLERVIREQSAAALQAALLQLPQGYREVIVLCDLQEVSYAEAAGMLAIPVGTVRSRLHRGHVALVDLLSRRGLPQSSGARS